MILVGTLLPLGQVSAQTEPLGTCTITNRTQPRNISYTIVKDLSEDSCQARESPPNFTVAWTQNPPAPVAPTSPPPPAATTAPATTPPAGYQLLAPLPCENSTPGCEGGELRTFNSDQPNNLGTYLNLMIKIFIGICAVLSVVMIVVGGLEYMTSELVHNKEAGKEKILGAIFGLILALGAYTLLFTINPDLLESDVRPTTLETASTGAPGLSGGAPAVRPGTPSSATCSIQSATFNPSGNQSDSWFNDDTPPTVRLQVVGSAGCAGKIAEVSIVEDDTVLVDDDVAGIDDFNVLFTDSNRFTIDLIAGETDCEQWLGNDCEYFIKIDLTGASNFSTEDQGGGGNLEYDCDGLCDEGWRMSTITPQ